MVTFAPLNLFPNSVVGWAEVPKGIPPANETAASEGVPGTAPAGVLPSGLRESVLLQPTMARMKAANTGARRRAILRESLNVYVMAIYLERGSGM